MTLEQHDAEAAAEATLRQSASLRDRLLSELDRLEVALQGVREVAEELPGTDTPTIVSETETTTTTRKWHLWKH